MKLPSHFFMLFCVLMLTQKLAFADNPISTAEKTTELSKLSQLIQHVQLGIQQDQTQKTHLDQKLQHTKQNINHLSVHLSSLDKNLSRENTALNSLQTSRLRDEQHLAQQKAKLAEQIRNAYSLSRYQYVDALLSQKDPAVISRTLAYYGYIHRARMASIFQLSNAIQAIKNNERHVATEAETIQSLREEQQNARDKLLAEARNHQKILGQLTSRIETNNQRLAELLANKAALEHVLKQLRVTQAQGFPSGNIAFDKLRGKLPWPTLGRISEHFGMSIEKSELKYSGILINAPKGQDTQAVYPGQIVFANWLQGFGLVLIIDHGNGYMSLYGHNEALYKKTGDRVKSGDVIATVGNSGGQEHTGLYFEIRHNGHPSNPENWLTRGSRRA